MEVLLQDIKICVVATAAGGKPYCDLIIYVPDDACKAIYMVQDRELAFIGSEYVRALIVCQ